MHKESVWRNFRRVSYLVFNIVLTFAAQAQESTNVEPQIVAAYFSPQTVHLGESATVFLQLTSGFRSPDRTQAFIEAVVDGTPVTLLHPSAQMWLLQTTPYNTVGTHTLAVTTLVEDADEANQIRQSITRLSQDILRLQDDIAHETDPVRRAQLQSELATKLTERTNLESALLGLRRIVGTDEFHFTVESNTDLNALYRNILLSQNHHILLQHSDGGFPFECPDENCSDPTQTSYPNQFGVHGVNLVHAYNATRQPLLQLTWRNTANVLLAKPIHRRTRLYVNDGEFLMAAAPVMGFTNYYAKGLASHVAEKEYSAAMHILNNPNPTTEAVDAVPQAQIDAITDAQKVAAFKRRFTELFGIIPNAMQYHWLQRVRQARLANDTAYAQALVNEVIANAASLTITADTYLLGLACTISALAPYRATIPAVGAVIDNAKTRLLAQQKTDGLFRVEASEGRPQGGLQDQAYIVQALLDAGEVTALARQLAALYTAQRLSGAYDDASVESTQAQAELLGAMSHVWTSQVGDTVWHLMQEHIRANKDLEQDDGADGAVPRLIHNAPTVQSVL